ncbi:MAG: glucose-1-phosphate thymidylyltransferase [Flavobacteriales bacterium]|nr:glucose-1-phosphate thymidylyltransferase [Flavobacteriales bacterium]|tara:strand:- start:1629 stop:2786 length:1158 start_codon:yes stop_codon:yes gene_type:complete
MNVILFDTDRENLFPLSLTRPISNFRVGILTIKEKWELYYKSVSVKTEEYLAEKFPCIIKKENLWINSSILPSEDLVTEINSLRKGELLKKGDVIIAVNNYKFDTSKLNEIECNSFYNRINDLWDIFSLNSEEIKIDFKKITKGRKSQKLEELSIKIGDYPLFIEKGAKIVSSFINCTNGPVYIGKDAEVMEGCFIRGPFAMSNNSVLKIMARIYEGTTLGPYCKVGGEVNNSVFFGFSSKSHEGYLGNSVIGEWCNLGADTNNSNLKNNYTEVKIWNYKMERFKKTGLQFCGLIMADHSKCGINTMFNTGTVVGVSANVFGSGFPRNIIPSFSWGGASGFTTYKTNKVFEVAELVMKRRNIVFSDLDKEILNKVFELTSKYRNY